MTTIADIRAEAAPGFMGNTANIVQVPRDRFEALCGVAEAALALRAVHDDPDAIGLRWDIASALGNLFAALDVLEAT